MGKPLIMGNYEIQGPPVRDAAGSEVNFSKRDQSADDDWLQERSIVQARTKDLVRNNEMAYGSLDQHTDAVVGKNFRLQPDVNARLLGFTREQHREITSEIMNTWKVDASSNQFWFDVAGEKSFTQLVAQHVRSYRVFGESFLVLYNRQLPETRKFGTAAGIIDPGRVYTPKKHQDDEAVIDGIKRSKFGYSQELYINRRHKPVSFYGGRTSANDDDFIALARRNKLGRDQFVHSYLQDLPGLSRGVPAFAPALKRLSCLGKFQDNTLEAAAWQATVAATIYSDHSDASRTFAQLDEKGNPQEMHPDDYHMKQAGTWNKRNGKVNGIDAKHLWAGERLELNSPGQPIARYAEFEHSMLKHFARALGTSVEWLTQDWSNTSFSGARAGLITTWRRIETERVNVAEQCANAIYCCWLEDNIANGRIKVPGIPDPDEAWFFFIQNRDAFTCASWFGPVKEEIDRSKTAAFYKTLKELNILTMSQVANELTDQSWQDLIDQQVTEQLYREDAFKNTRLKIEEEQQ